MASVIKPPQTLAGDVSKSRLYKLLTLMAGSAILISAAVILWFDQANSRASTDGIAEGLVLVAQTLMPYLISAAVAALTAIAILTVLPALRIVEPAQAVAVRLRQLREGDLCSPLRVPVQTHLSLVASELNETVSTLGQQLAHLKLINRRQWDHLQHARAAVADNDPSQALEHIARMEKNWDKIAEIENSLITG
jgi:methyl-accepting chemotaxis protein